MTVLPDDKSNCMRMNDLPEGPGFAIAAYGVKPYASVMSVTPSNWISSLCAEPKPFSVCMLGLQS
eukprot:6483691-Amphidinium_carterae.4